MPRHGNTRKSKGRSNGHRMHRRGRIARKAAKFGSGRGSKAMAWGRAAV